MSEQPVHFGMALITGLFGAGHCFGMCGGLVGAFSLTARSHGGLVFMGLYNLGRISTYVMLGALAGAVGGKLDTTALKSAGRWILVGGDAFVIAVGLWAAWRGGHSPMSRGAILPASWMAAATRRLTRLPSGISALPLGLLMGLLPCGFLYAMLVHAGTTATGGRGALTMLGFGLGTAPALLSVGLTAHLLSQRARATLWRIAGTGITVLGVYQLARHGGALGWW